MRALLKPVVARELGIVLLKPGSELMSLFSCEKANNLNITRTPPQRGFWFPAIRQGYSRGA